MPDRSIPRSQRAIHNGLWVAGRLCSSFPPAADLVGKLEQRNQDRVVEKLSRFGPGKLRPVERVTSLDNKTFQRDYVRQGKPVVFAGAAREWPCCKKWSPKYFEETCGDFRFPVLPPSAKDASGHVQEPETVSVGDAMRALQNGEKTYVRFLPLLKAYPGLQRDFDMAWLESRRGPLGLFSIYQLFVGSANTDTSMHGAMSNNLFVQVMGRKRWRIFPTRFTPVMRPVVANSPYFSSMVNPDNPNPDTHPAYIFADGWEVELQPGDILYNPPFYWHQVENPTVTIGLGFRWLGVPSILRSSATQTALTLTATDPPFWDQTGERGLRAAARQVSK